MVDHPLADGDDAGAHEALEAIKTLLSPQILTILQLLGFNYKQAIGQPLTDIVRAHIMQMLPQPTAAVLAERQHGTMLMAAQIASDPAAFERFMSLAQLADPGE